MAWSEDAIHRRLARGARPRGLAGSRMHDAAVLAPRRGNVVACVDHVIEGVHVLASARARAIGRKAACRALSDLAATAAEPRALLCAAAVPRARSERWIGDVLDGVRAAAREHGADLVGGDLSSTRGPAVISVTAIGRLAVPRAPGRDRARIGQLVVLTGPVGGSARGRHLAIEPRIAHGIALARAGATAMMDVSDGLAWDLFRLARASKVGIELDLASIPVHADAVRLARTSGRDALDHALHDGEDHELVATIDRRRLARWKPRELAFLATLTIGRVVRGGGVVLVHADGRRERWTHARGGFEHG